MQGRGLKPRTLDKLWNGFFVAPYAGAWIETPFLMSFPAPPPSPLMQGRGLKHPDAHPASMITESPLMQGRGLKLV